jgi:hypothetical protein
LFTELSDIISPMRCAGRNWLSANILFSSGSESVVDFFCSYKNFSVRLSRSCPLFCIYFCIILTLFWNWEIFLLCSFSCCYFFDSSFFNITNSRYIFSWFYWFFWVSFLKLYNDYYNLLFSVINY